MNKLNYSSASFLILQPIIAICGTCYVIWHEGFIWQTWVLLFILYLISGLSITAGYHRLFCHRSYQASKAVRWFFLIFSTMTLSRDAITWSSRHRRHHQYTDKEQDPYNGSKGFWHSHLVSLFRNHYLSNDYSNVKDLLSDPLAKWQRQYFYLIAMLVGILSPVLISLLWNDPMGGFFIAVMLRITITHHTSFLVNSAAHQWGKQPYHQQDSSYDNWIVALLTLGEGYHNFHHAYPYDYRNGYRWWQYDPTKWLIKLLFWLGHASELRQAKIKK